VRPGASTKLGFAVEFMCVVLLRSS